MSAPTSFPETKTHVGIPVKMQGSSLGDRAACLTRTEGSSFPKARDVRTEVSWVGKASGNPDTSGDFPAKTFPGKRTGEGEVGCQVSL